MTIYMEKASKKIYHLLIKVLSTVEIDTFLNLINNIGNNLNRVLRRLNNFPYIKNQIIQHYGVGALGYSKARPKRWDASRLGRKKLCSLCWCREGLHEEVSVNHKIKQRHTHTHIKQQHLHKLLNHQCCFQGCRIKEQCTNNSFISFFKKMYQIGVIKNTQVVMNSKDAHDNDISQRMRGYPALLGLITTIHSLSDAIPYAPLESLCLKPSKMLTFMLLRVVDLFPLLILFFW